MSSIAATVGVAVALGRADQADTPAAETVAVEAVSTTSSKAKSTPTTPTTTGSGTYADGVYLGPAESTKWGDVQVQVTIQDGEITSVAEVQAPDSDRKSISINSRAQPVLESEALAAQTANIRAVSGATYTSQSYTTSLQAALDQASQAS